jgi:signal peptide peptidase SppA
MTPTTAPWDAPAKANETNLMSLFMPGHERPWAMAAAGLQALLDSRQDVEAVASRLGSFVDKGSPNLRNHQGTAVIDVRGPLFRYRSIFTWLLGGSAVETIAHDLGAALRDPGVQRIVLAINSPGGQVDGINELSNMIRSADATKPVVAYVDGMAASGAYWLASAARRIVADETAQLGSIGVVATVTDSKAAEEKRGLKRYEFVSSQSPLKRASPESKEGRSALQTMVDALADIFIAKVAQYRGTTEEAVANNFGRGGLLTAADAIASGMADGLGSLDALLAAPMTAQHASVRHAAAKPFSISAAFKAAMKECPECGGTGEVDGEECPECGGTGEVDENDAKAKAQSGDKDDEKDDEEEDGKEGKAVVKTQPTDRQRIAAILTCEEAKGRDDLARVLALETDHSLEVAQKILKASPTAAAQPAGANALEARMAELGNPKVGVAGDEALNTEAAEIARILSFVPQTRKRAQVQ